MKEKNASDPSPGKKTSAKKTKSHDPGFEKEVAGDEQKTIVDHAIQEHLHLSVSLQRPSSQINSLKEKSGLGNILNERFELLEEIGSGGMGVVYKALDIRDIEVGNSIFIAIKVLKDECKNDPIILKALHSETRKTQKLAHPNIVRVYDFDRDANRDMVYMTMEFLEGVTLSKLIKAHPNGLEPTLAMTIIEQLGEALTYAHSQQVIHSDFKPGNIIIDKENHIKVLDFGIARLANSARITEFDAGVLGGMSPVYASLEMLNGIGPDQRDDVYALACVAYELFTGQHPFNRRNAVQTRLERYKPKRIKSLNKRQWCALSKGLELKRDIRTKTVKELIHGLHGGSNRKLHFTILSMLGVILLFIWQLGLVPKITTSFEPLSTRNIPASKPPDNIQDIKIKIQTDKRKYYLNDPFSINFSVNKPAYVRVVVVNSKGEINTLFPNELQENIYCLPGINYHIPPLDSDIFLQVEGPTGLDRIIAVASNKPFSNKVMKLKQNGNLLAEDEPKKFTVAVHEYIIE